MDWILIIIHVVFIFLLILPTVVAFIARLRPHRIPNTERESNVACIITAYQRLDLSVPLIQSLLKQSYPTFHIFLVADDCEGVEWNETSDRLTVLRPQKPLRSKIKSLRFAVEQLDASFESIFILDPDNLVHPQALSILNRYAQAGYRAVQGQRRAKNLDTLYAQIDAMCELYYNQAMRNHFYRAGSSSTIAGSGVLIDADTFRLCLQAPVLQDDYEGPFIDEDKLIQHLLVGNNTRIAFAADSIIFDEKVSEGAQVQSQRSRWLQSHFLQMPGAFKLIGKGILKGNFHQVLFGLSTAFPPLFVLALSSALLLLFDLIFYPKGIVPLVAAGAIFTVNFLVSLRLAKAPKEVWQSFIHIPFFVWRQIKGLLGMKKRTGNVAPTQNVHQVGIEDMMPKDSKGEGI